MEEGTQCGWWGRGNALEPSFGTELKMVEVESKERNGINGKKKLKNHVFQFRMNMRKIRINVRNRPEEDFGCSSKGRSENWFRMTMRKFLTVMRNAPGRRKWYWWTFHFAQSCEIVFFLDFLVKKPSEDLLDDAKCPLNLGL